MGIDVPSLDDREYEAFVEDALNLIPAYAEEWTDFNPHDPGITIVEVLAWLSESYVYQLDQVTDEHRRQYARLLGERPRPPTSAAALLALDPPPGVDGSIPEGTPLTATDGTEAVRRFETDHDVALASAPLERVATSTAAGTTDDTHANDTEGMYFRPFGSRPREGDALYLGFDGDPFGESGRLTLSVAFHDDDLPEPATHDCDQAPFEPSIELRWQAVADGWVDLECRADGTNSLYGSGPVQLSRPGDRRPEPGLPSEAAIDGPDLTWLRCRLDRDGYEIPPQVDAVACDRVRAVHRRTVTGESLQRLRRPDEPPALDGQAFAFERSPVRSADVFVDGERWTAVDALHASGPDDPHYVLDHVAGELRFGDGVHGRAPPADAAVVADYVAGGGDAGNVPSDAVWRFADAATQRAAREAAVDPTVVDVAPLSAGTGGEPAESVDDALRRLRRELRRPHRAVTTDDYEHLAEQTTGLRVGRTNVLVDGDAVTVVVVPYAPTDVPKPSPSEGFLDAVRSHLQRHRLAGDRVRVRPPTYVGLEVDVRGRASDRFLGDGHERAVRTAVREYLHPLCGAGGDGWPFGRAVGPSDLADRLRTLDALDSVADVAVRAHGGGTIEADGTVQIDGRSLFYVEAVTTDLSAARTAPGGGR